MFNNLNNTNNQNHQEVDDIFAETDSSKGSALGNTGIETRRVGLGTDVTGVEDPIEKSGGGKALKIVLILVVVSIVGLGGYLAYSKFFNNSTGDGTNIAATSSNSAVNPNGAVNNNQTGETGSVVTPASERNNPVDGLASSSNPTGLETPLVPGSNAPGDGLVPTSTLPAIVNVDSDLDGLSDIEEIKAGSNPNVIDSDNDGLSDYEEVIIYKTNPNNPDTDGDGYLDGAEVKSGYDPNVAGAKMPI